MATAPRISDFDDPTFNPFRAIDHFQGLYEVDDPYPKIRALHKTGSVIQGDIRQEFGLEPFPMWVDYPSWMVFGHSAVTTVFGDASNFSSTIWQEFFKDCFGDSITGMDAPDHTRYRRLFQKAFLPQIIALWSADLMPRVINSRIDDFIGRGRAELVSEFTALYPFQIIYDQLKLPSEDRALFHKLSVGSTIPNDHAHTLEGSKKLGDYFAYLLNERRDALARGTITADGDVISMLALAEVDGERLPDHITISFLRQLFAAAGDNTYRNTGVALVGLLTNPDQLDAVRRDRTLMPKAIEEALRWDGPITVGTRVTARDVVLEGVSIPAGAKVDVIQGSANRDPGRYENPDDYNIFREARSHTSFGNGPHVCIGQHLARMEMTHALNILLDRLPNLRLDPDKPAPRVTGLSSRSSTAIHVIFD